ncbi:MAG: hypothetical protein V4480_00085 [Patescibacteria group bacterium]
MARTYLITERVGLLMDSPKNIDFHIRSGDYFAFLATVMGFLEDTATDASNAAGEEKRRDIARELRHDLRYVQANYQILPRDLGDIETINPSGNLLLR